MKRKIFSVIFLMFLIIPCLTLVACKKNNKLEGCFYVATVSLISEDNSVILTKTDLNALVNKPNKTTEEVFQAEIATMLFDMSFNFKKDGKVDAVEMGINVSGTYTLNGEDLSINCEGKTINGKYKDGKISLTMEEEGYTIVLLFEKQ